LFADHGHELEVLAPHGLLHFEAVVRERVNHDAAIKIETNYYFEVVSKSTIWDSVLMINLPKGA